jgi:putative SOS response-associated peptidase YedK
MQKPSKRPMCVLMRDGEEVWLDGEGAESLQDMLEENDGAQFLAVGGRVFETANVSGVFSEATMQDIWRRKGGASA